jgi:sulfide:quinone oxidoreductase
MGVTGPHVSGAVRSLVESKGIGYHPEHQVTSVDPAARRIAFANGVSAEYDLLVYVPTHRAPAAVSASGLVANTGWIAVDRETFTTAWPMVFAIGDVTSVPLSIGKPLPKAGVFAHEQAEVVAHNLASTWSDRAPRRRFDGHGKCFLETGDGRAGMGAGDFYGEPSPQVALYRPARWWHWSKVLLERTWFRRWL